MLKRLLKGGAILAVLLLMTATVGLIYRAYRQHETAQLLVMTTPDAIDEASFVRIGGVDQWIQVRGERRGNPVILFLHGGPGFTAIPYFQRVMRTWERDFTIVHWDQRGAGKSFARNGGAQQPHPTIEQMIADGVEVAEHVRHRLGQSKLILVGYSWGSVLGVEMARERPDLLHAFVGTGQVVDTVQSETVSYYGLLQRARAAGDDDSAAALMEIGPPPYARFELLGRQREVLNKYPPSGERELNQFTTLLLSPGYSLSDVWDVYFRAPELTREMLAVVLKYKITDRGATFAVPLFFFQGAEDLWTSTEVVKKYLPLLAAPHKEIVLFEHVGHHAVEVAGEQFLAELNARVKPLAQQPLATAQSSVQ
jgi:pimeloyl-ACP methyl ester carboxylesterase